MNLPDSMQLLLDVFVCLSPFNERLDKRDIVVFAGLKTKAIM